MDTLITIGQFALSLSILIILHECGHFFPARWFKTRVEKFYLFFDPWFSLFKVKKGETEYGIGWLPFGGYVKISGMIDESFDKEQMAGPPQPWEFRSKKAWQRLIIMLGGVTVNFILGIVLFAFILMQWGEEYLPNENAKFGIAAEELGREMGLQDGDLVLSVGGVFLDKFSPAQVAKEIVINEAESLSVRRNDEVIELPIPENFVQLLSAYENKDKILFSIRYPLMVKGLPEGSNGKEIGLQIDDALLTINGEPVQYAHEFAQVRDAYIGKEIILGVLRGNDTLYFDTALDENGLIGFEPYPPSHFFSSESTKYGLASALAGGVNQSYTFIADQAKAFGQMFRGKIKASDSLGSFITIGKMYGSSWDWRRFWWMTATLSVLLGFINLLPIPALDGGHVMFLLWEVLTGRKPSDKVLEYSTMVGFFLLILLMVYALGLDISRLF